MSNIWYIIINPISGKRKGLKDLNLIKDTFSSHQIPFNITITKYIHHENEIVQQAIKQGYTKFVCIGGDGTLHHIVNGIMNQSIIKTDQIKLAVIPIGTGNDWVKTYGISKNLNKAILTIKEEYSVFQNIGKITFNDSKQVFYFNNVAGIGYDGLVVNNLPKFKKYGSISYLLSGIFSYYKYNTLNIYLLFNNLKLNTSLFLLVIGLCKYSGGGLQLADFKNHKLDYFDISLIKEINLTTILKNLFNLYKGKINKVKQVETSLSQHIIAEHSHHKFFVQADGEVLGREKNITINIAHHKLCFVVPKNKF